MALPGESAVPGAFDEIVPVVPAQFEGGADPTADFDRRSPAAAILEQADQEAAAATAAEETARQKITDAWSVSFHEARRVAGSVVMTYGRCVEASSGGHELPEDDEVSPAPQTDAELGAKLLAQDTVLVELSLNKPGLSPKTWIPYFTHSVNENPFKHGWTLAEMQAPTEPKPATQTSNSRSLRDQLDGNRTAAPEDDAVVYDRDAKVERVILVNGTRHALMLVRGTRGELDKATPTRVALVDEGDADERGKIEEYASRNSFLVTGDVQIITPDNVHALGLRDPEAMGRKVAGGMFALLNLVKQFENV